MSTFNLQEALRIKRESPPDERPLTERLRESRRRYNVLDDNRRWGRGIERAEGERSFRGADNAAVNMNPCSEMPLGNNADRMWLDREESMRAAPPSRSEFEGERVINMTPPSDATHAITREMIAGAGITSSHTIPLEEMIPEDYDEIISENRELEEENQRLRVELGELRNGL